MYCQEKSTESKIVERSRKSHDANSHIEHGAGQDDERFGTSDV